MPRWHRGREGAFSEPGYCHTSPWRAIGAGGTGHGFNPSLEGLRGFAAVLVVLAHTLPDQGGFTVGVDIFFVLSGALITRLVVDELSRTGTASLRRFYIRRAFRLFPALFLFLVAVLVWTQFLCPAIGVASVHGTVLNSLLYVENWHIIAVANAANPAFPADPASQAWSLSVEEQFYVFWPILLIATWKWKGQRAALAVAAAGLILSLTEIYGLAWFGTTYARVYFGSDTRAAELLAGCCITLLAQCGWLPRVPRFAAGAALLAIVAVAALQLPLVYQVYAMVVLGSILVAGLTQHALWPLDTTVARWLGSRSYAIYLWHPFMAAILVYQFHFGNGVGMLVCVLAVTLVIAEASYRGVEHPLRELGRRLANRPITFLQGRPMASASVGDPGKEGTQKPSAA
jgi:peptidoglycan/LPS O-acetylase OafA/YrhL